MFSSFSLKLIAIFAMTLDHIGHIFFPEHLWMRLVERIAMPIFAFLIAEGFRHTTSIKKYARRLFIWGMISILPYYLAFGWTQNVYFTLLFGLLALYFMENASSKERKFLIFLLFCLLATVFLCDWFFVGVLMVVGFYYANYNKKKILAVLLLSAFSLLLIFFFYALYRENIRYFLSNLVQIGVLLSFLFLPLYNKKEGKKIRYLFYAYYPLHLLILWGIDSFCH